MEASRITLVEGKTVLLCMLTKQLGDFITVAYMKLSTSDVVISLVEMN